MIRLLAVMLLGLMAFAAPSATAQPNLQALLASVFPEASAFGPVEGNPPAAAAYRDGRLVGYVFHTLDVVGSTGYSGKPLNIAVGMNLEGRIVGAKLTSHAEPILVLGINPIRLEEFVAGHRNLDIRAPVRAEKADTSAGSPDIIAGATVSSLLLREAIIRAGRAIARSRGLFGAAAAATVELDAFEPKTWLDLASESAIVRLRFTGSEIAFRLAAASMQPATDIPPDGLFADLYLALVTPAGIGRNILADRDFGRLMSATTPGDHWLLLAANGLYSFKG
ncbi:MAG: FMN-binding protein, partial [Alphaproteobacteria bacterium]|nr:FMN-binding protein [Alphaproteobacteria bacterium]